MVDLMLSLFDQQAKLIEEQAAQIKKLEARIASLESNSRNSSKPPSSDKGNFGNPPKPKSLRPKTGRKKGGQAGHQGHTLGKVSHPDSIVKHALQPAITCPKCSQLTTTIPTGHQSRQVFDTPPIKVHVTEHQAQQCHCQHCNTKITANFPEGVTAPVQYGSNLQAACVYLSSYQLLPYGRLSELFQDLFNIPISKGTLANMVASAGEKAKEATAPIRKALTQGNVLHSDETGCSLLGKRHWLHVASTSALTLYHFDQKRGHEAMINMGVLDLFRGYLVHDCLGAYFKFSQFKHALCNAHLLRELIYALEQLDQIWAQKLINLLLKAKNQTEQSPKALSAERRKTIRTAYQEVVKEGLALNPEPAPEPGKRGRPKRSKQLNLLRRLDQHAEAFLAFVSEPEVPFDNNQAERDLRMMKVREKVSGGFGTEQRAIDFCSIRSIISSAGKQGKNVLQAISSMLIDPQKIGAELAEVSYT